MPFFLHRVVGQETQLQRVQGETLLIGRGTGAQLRFPGDAAVDLEHALIRHDEKGYLLLDQGSVTGTYLNGQAVERARLSNEDRIEIGGYQIRVQLTHRNDPLFLHVRSVAAPEEAPVEMATQRFSAAAVRDAIARASRQAAPPAAAPPTPPAAEEEPAEAATRRFSAATVRAAIARASRPRRAEEEPPRPPPAAEEAPADVSTQELSKTAVEAAAGAPPEPAAAAVAETPREGAPPAAAETPSKEAPPAAPETRPAEPPPSAAAPPAEPPSSATAPPAEPPPSAAAPPPSPPPRPATPRPPAAPPPAAPPPAAPPASAPPSAASPPAAPPPAVRAPAAPRVATRRRIDYAAAFALERPWIGKAGLSLLGLGAAAAAALVAFAGPAATRPGPVSTAHANVGLGSDCAACHAPWQGAASARCEECHAGPEHQPTQAFAPPCGDCHSEHLRLPRLALVGDGDCLACHRDLTLRGGGEPGVARAITSFDDHPDFPLPEDPNPLRLDHALHLKDGLRGPGGATRLECQSCHAFDDARGEILSVVFEDHCQSCHALTFDDRFPDQQAPHGDPDAVLTAIFGTYARGQAALAGLSSDEIRRLIFQRGAGTPFQQRIFQQAVSAVRHTLQYRCSVCHRVERRTETEASVEEPIVIDTWLDGARFSHGPHRVLACTDCHAAAVASTATADVLIPGIDSCVRCHGSAQAARAPEERAPSTCVTCHHYHARTPEGWEATLAGRPVGRGRGTAGEAGR